MIKIITLCLFALAMTLAGADAIPENAEKIMIAFVANSPLDISTVANKQMAAALSGNNFSKMCQKTITQYGNFTGWESEPSIKKITDKNVDYLQVTRVAQFARQRLSVLCAVEEKSGKVAGFFLKPLPDKPQIKNNDAFREEELSFGSNWKLNGTLTIPVKPENFPIVILVHGSGPNDRNESIGPNQTFAEIAHGLATKGIGSFRYDKRTFIYGKELIGKQITVDEEVTDDVILALEILHEKFPQSPIFVLGHSLGGMLLPRISTKTAIPTGYIFMAAPARSLEAIIDEQFHYLISIQIADTTERTKILEAKRTELREAMGAAYLAETSALNQVTVAKGMTAPMLFLQGGRDYQITIIDFNLWQEALKGKEKVKFHLYDNLNHLMQPGQGKSTPTEYTQKVKFSDQVIDHIAQFVKEN